MKASFVTLIGLQALLAAAGPAKSPAEEIKERLAEVSANDVGLSKRACNFASCNDCWSRYSYCIQCSGPRGTPASCVSCLIRCQGECGC